MSSVAGAARVRHGRSDDCLVAQLLHGCGWRRKKSGTKPTSQCGVHGRRRKHGTPRCGSSIGIMSAERVCATPLGEFVNGQDRAARAAAVEHPARPERLASQRTDGCLRVATSQSSRRHVGSRSLSAHWTRMPMHKRLIVSGDVLSATRLDTTAMWVNTVRSQGTPKCVRNPRMSSGYRLLSSDIVSHFQTHAQYTRMMIPRRAHHVCTHDVEPRDFFH